MFSLKQTFLHIILLMYIRYLNEEIQNRIQNGVLSVDKALILPWSCG